MKSCEINGTIITRSEELPLDEAMEYLKLIQAKFNKHITELTIEADGDFVNCDYKFSGVPFERIRRITGYLSTLETWNPGKLAEEKDRVKHGVGLEKI